MATNAAQAHAVNISHAQTVMAVMAVMAAMAMVNVVVLDKMMTIAKNAAPLHLVVISLLLRVMASVVNMVSVVHLIEMPVQKVAVKDVAKAVQKVVLLPHAVKVALIMVVHTKTAMTVMTVMIATNVVIDQLAKIIVANVVLHVAALKPVLKVVLKAVLVSVMISKVALVSLHLKSHHLAAHAPMANAKKSKKSQMIGAIKITIGNNKPNATNMPTTCLMSNL